MDHNPESSIENGDHIEMSQTIGDNFSGTKEINIGGGSPEGDVQAGIEFIYHMREHLVDIGLATIYGLIVYAAVLWINKKIGG